jgi:enoyl-CoA hydratase
MLIMSQDVLLETRGPIGLITLNRSQALNALSLEMIRAIHRQMTAWATDPSVRAVVIRGAGGKAFCAGGDVRAVATSLGQPVAEGQQPLSRSYFHEEYGLNRLIHYYDKPYLAFLDGISMGGGLGLSRHGSHRIVTDRLVFSMPETAIGFFPDVGGGWFLPRFPGQVGTYLALTGARGNAADAQWCGYATHYVDPSRLDGLLDALVRADWTQAPLHAVATQIVASFCTQAGPAPLSVHREAIDRCFAKERVEDILAALAAEGTEWAETTRATLGKMSPTSLKVTLRQLRKCRSLTYDEILAIEFRLSQRLCLLPDFREGIRALLVDKDRNPRWSPATLAEVRDDVVESYFAPLEGGEWAP